MSFEWNIILWCLITLGFLVVCFLILYYIISARSLKKRRADLINTLDSLKPGKDILFAGGIKGTIVKAGEEYLDVEIAKNMVITISRLSVSQILTKGKKHSENTK